MKYANNSSFFTKKIFFDIFATDHSRVTNKQPQQTPRLFEVNRLENYSALGSSAAGAASTGASSAFGAAFLPARRVDFFAAFLVSLSMFSL